MNFDLMHIKLIFLIRANHNQYLLMFKEKMIYLLKIGAKSN